MWSCWKQLCWWLSDRRACLRCGRLVHDLFSRWCHHRTGGLIRHLVGVIGRVWAAVWSHITAVNTIWGCSRSAHPSSRIGCPWVWAGRCTIARCIRVGRGWPWLRGCMAGDPCWPWFIDPDADEYVELLGLIDPGDDGDASGYPWYRGGFLPPVGMEYHYCTHLHLPVPSDSAFPAGRVSPVLLILPLIFAVAFQPSVAFAIFHCTYRNPTFQRALTPLRNSETWWQSFAVFQGVNKSVVWEGGPVG